MAINTSPSSRRALLAAAAGGTVALVAESLARPLAARAQEPEYVVLGGANESSSATSLRIDDGGTMSGAPALSLRNDGGSTMYGAPALQAMSHFGAAIDAYSVEGYAIHAESNREAITAVSLESIAVVGYGGEFGDTNPATNLTGVRGWSYAGAGVDGQSPVGTGVCGTSETGTGVSARGNEGVHAEGDMAGVFGGSSAGTGVQGKSGGGWGVTGASDGTEFGASGGVFGMSDKTVGIFGLSAEGIAVEGRSDHDPATGTGVKGYSRKGEGVLGESEEGTAVRATAVTPAATALRVEGRVAFQTAGLGAIAAGTKSAMVNPGVPLTAATKVLVTLMSDPGLRALKYVSVDPTADTFTVHLTGLAARTPISFAWFVIE